LLPNVLRQSKDMPKNLRELPYRLREMPAQSICHYEGVRLTTDVPSHLSSTVV